MPETEVPEVLDFSTLLRDFVNANAGGGSGAVWLAKMAIDPDTGKKVLNRQSAHDLLTTRRAGSIGRPTVRALAALMGVSRQTIWIANGVELDFGPPPGGAFAATVPGYVDDLPVREQMHLRDEMALFGRAHGLID